MSSDEKSPHVKKHRHSLQPQSNIEPGPFRHTKSQNYDSKLNKKNTNKLPPPIYEADSNDDDDDTVSPIQVDARNDSVKLSFSYKNEKRHSKSSKSSRKSQVSSSKETHTYDNQAFESGSDTVPKNEELSRSNSAANSVRSSTRDPSVQSLTVIREQYCCCSRWTPLERTLCAGIGVLAFIIIALVITVVFLARGGPENSALNFHL